MSEEEPQAQTVDQPAVTPDPGAGAHREANLDALLDVPVNVTVEIGRLGQGSVVPLDRLVGQAHDVLVNGTLIAQGEVVVVDDKFGIRFTEIVSPTERVKRLK